jgi:DNA-binding protein YbaB
MFGNMADMMGLMGKMKDLQSRMKEAQEQLVYITRNCGIGWGNGESHRRRKEKAA